MDRTYKRTRKRKSDGRVSSSSSQQAELSSLPRKLSAVLRGRTLAVSTLVQSSTEAEPEAYCKLISLCKDLGAQTTGQIHRRVHALIATQSAVDGNTQRVRKAWKKGIPVVSPDWLRKCQQKCSYIDMEAYCINRSTSVANGAEEKPKKKAKLVARDHSIQKATGEPKSISLGCCCACHEDTKGVTECSWCVDCDVKQAAALKEAEAIERNDAVTIDLGCCCVCHEDAQGPTECPWCVECSVNKNLRNSN